MENINIYNLLPEEIVETINKLTDALEIIKHRKNTNSKFLEKEKTTHDCPKCGSKNVVKNGHDKNKVQTYKCKDCKKKFNSCTGTTIAHTKLNYEQLTIFFECMNDKLSIKKTAAKMQVNKNTAFLLRHKVLASLSIIREKLQLEGNIEADEIYESINLKGTKPKDMPRASKHRSSKGGSKRGISNHQVCIASAIDEHDNCFLEIVGTGPITSDEVEKVFKNKLGSVSNFITDCKSSYEKFINDNHINLEQIKSGTYVSSSGYSLGNINSLHSELSTFLASFRGVSTKHLQHYLDWLCFQKIINYTVEIIKQPIITMKKTIINSSSINSNTIYNNSSGINFKLVYANYKFHPL